MNPNRNRTIRHAGQTHEVTDIDNRSAVDISDEVLDFVRSANPALDSDKAIDIAVSITERIL